MGSSAPCDGILGDESQFQLTNSRGASGLDGFADLEWGNSSVSRRSTTGSMARYTETIVLLRSKMQKTISLSTAVAEYYAASEMAIEVTYLCNLLK